MNSVVIKGKNNQNMLLGINFPVIKPNLKFDLTKENYFEIEIGKEIPL